MENILKFTFIAIVLAASFSTTTYAYQCNTVMGGCPADTTQATSAHMRSDTGIKVDHAPKTLPVKAVAIPTMTGTQNKLDSKKSNDQGVMQTLNKTILK